MAQTGSTSGGPSAWRSRPSTRSRPGAVASSAAASGCGWERSRWGWTACAATSRTCPCTSGSTSRKREEVSVSNEINIQFTRFSAFYSPLIATLAGGFLREAGFQPKHSVAPPGKSAIEGLVSGTVHVAQSAPSQGFGPLEKGQRPPAVHFAQINEKDGFFLTARAPDPAFTWDKLKGRQVLVDHGGQPLAMFKYACHRRGPGHSRLPPRGIPRRPMGRALRKGEGGSLHHPGPAPPQLQPDRRRPLVAPLRGAVGPCAFSSLAATREWLGADTAKRFMGAYRKARAWLIDTPAAKVAEAEASFFPEIDRAVLASTIAYYQRLG